MPTREATERPLCKCGHTFFMHDGGGIEGCDESDGKDFCDCKQYVPAPPSPEGQRADTVDLRKAVSYLAAHTEGEARAFVEFISTRLGFGHAIDAKPEPLPNTPQEERKSVEMFYEAELWIRHSSPISQGGQAWMDREQFSKALDEFINTVPLAAPKVVDSKEEQEADLRLECFGYLRLMDHFYGEEYVPEDSGAQICITNIRKLINMPPVKPKPKVEEQDGGEELPPIRASEEDLEVAVRWMNQCSRPISEGHLQAFAEYLACRERQLRQALHENKLLKAKSVESLSPSEPTK